MSITTAIREFQYLVIAEKTKLIQEPNLILIFGGNADVEKTTPVSCRGVFIESVLKAKIAGHYRFHLPEYYEKEWNKYDGYGNLVDFEVDAASLTSQVVIFLESPGSICEFGLFSAYKEFKNKLFLILSNGHYESPSFIVNGPIKLIPEDSVYVLENDKIEDIESFKNQVSTVIDSLANKLNKHRYHPNKQQLDINILRHQFLLIVDLINLFYFLTFEQVHEILKFLSISLTEDRLKVMLYQLTVFEFIESKKVGTQTYYYSLHTTHSFIDYTGTNDKAFDKLAFKIKLSEKITEDNTVRKIYEHYQSVVKI